MEREREGEKGSERERERERKKYCKEITIFLRKKNNSRKENKNFDEKQIGNFVLINFLMYYSACELFKKKILLRKKTRNFS